MRDAMRFQFLLFILIHCNAVGQSLSNENLTHLYDPRDEIDFSWLMVRQDGNITLSYSISSVTDNASPEMYLMQWEERDSYTQRQGKVIKGDSVLLTSGKVNKGEIQVTPRDEPWLLLLSVTKVTNSKNWSYPFLIEKNYPVNGFVKDGSEKVFENYLKPGKPYSIFGPSGKQKLFVYVYSKSFSSAFPPFSKSAAPVDPLLLPDSAFSIDNGSVVTFSREGVYLVQSDTLSAEGFAFRINTTSFPKYTRVQDLVEPLVFICTKEEFNKLLQANGDKVEFDKTVLNITRDRDRAKRFMRSYYNRVELANQYFSSYKEGWKTDMGMTYIIFGLPDEIRKTAQNEIWYYKGSRTKFVFIKKGSVYDPNYYVLMRDDRFTQLWYNTIDLWRKSRF